MFNFKKIAEKYKLIMVDIDNTLFNYTFAHKNALEVVMKLYSFTLEDYDLAKKMIAKRGLSANHHKKELYFKIICENKNIHFSKASEMFELYVSIFTRNLKVDKTMFEFLCFIKSLNKKVIAITNFYFIEQIHKLNCANLTNMIDYLVCSEEFELEKPNKALVNRALELYGKFIDEEEIVMIGDSIADNFLGGGYRINYYPYNCSKLLISISGKSGSGKTTLSNAINEIYKSFIISTDGYHKYERHSKIWERVTHYNPKANNLIQLAMDIKHIYQDIGNKLHIPIYDHKNGVIVKSDEIEIKDLDIVIIEGLHTLYQEVIGDFVKIKIYIDSDEADRQKIDRDSKERNYSHSKIIDTIQKREEDYKKYLEKQKDNANFLILVRDGIFKIYLKDILLNNYLQKEYTGRYEDLIQTVKDIFDLILKNRWVKENDA
ncbi:HAD-IA family hydrolase [Campylobacter jejuni]|uniref:phosphoribulokinase n=2 Tax=Campylobacter TaxID=194 RepID=A0A5T0J1L2_CAMCO|nr:MULTISPECIES: HAD-IA family hydrolase [Campylobacter]AON69315.1 putative kinase [Campylobacter jejuni subsp. jejuni]EAH5008676.1 uridine kinase [Campylobacter jejuni]EAH6115579.1 uridine kinase [Campylobacter jejuni]EAH6876284.1 uridine kinase [Campylobacter coli]EAH7548274.1 uridine kinase [Campylobacter jejuni]